MIKKRTANLKKGREDRDKRREKIPDGRSNRNTTFGKTCYWEKKKLI